MSMSQNATTLRNFFRIMQIRSVWRHAVCMAVRSTRISYRVSSSPWIYVSRRAVKTFVVSDNTGELCIQNLKSSETLETENLLHVDKLDNSMKLYRKLNFFFNIKSWSVDLECCCTMKLFETNLWSCQD